MDVKKAQVGEIYSSLIGSSCSATFLGRKPLPSPSAGDRLVFKITACDENTRILDEFNSIRERLNTRGLKVRRTFEGSYSDRNTQDLCQGGGGGDLCLQKLFSTIFTPCIRSHMLKGRKQSRPGPFQFVLVASEFSHRQGGVRSFGCQRQNFNVQASNLTFILESIDQKNSPVCSWSHVKILTPRHLCVNPYNLISGMDRLHR